jgi:error-prone DNA polymerase
MATFKRVGTIENFEKMFFERMVARGYDPTFAASCFSQIRGFGEYGFPESHAASFANLVYASCWMKCRYPDVFAAALLNSQPMGFYAPAQIVRDAQDHGVAVRSVDVNLSDWDCRLEFRHPEVRAKRASKDDDVAPRGAPDLVGRAPQGDGGLHPRHAAMKNDIRTTHALRLGFRQVSGFSEAHGLRIESLRGRGFDSVRDLWLRTRLPPAVLERLANADAFGSLGLTRRDALWAVRALQRTGDKDDLPLFARVAMPPLEPDVALPAMPPGEQVVEDYRHLHLSLKAHPVSFLRADLDRRGIRPAPRRA